MNESQNAPNQAASKAPPTPGIDQASSDNLAKLIELGTDTIEAEVSPPITPRHWRASSAGVVFSLAVACFIVGVGWWSWRMLEMGADLREQSKSVPMEQVDTEEPRVASPWETVKTQSIPTDGQIIALEAAFNSEGNALLAAFSDGTTRLYPLTDDQLRPPQKLEGAKAYPLAVAFGAKDRPSLITQDGKTIQTFGPAEGPEIQPLNPPITEAYCWTTDILVASPHPFDGSILISDQDEQVSHNALRFAGTDPHSRKVVFLKRLGLTRLSVLDLSDNSLDFLDAPAKVHRAALSPSGKQIVLVNVDGSFTCLDVESGQVQWERKHVPGISRPHVSFTPTGEVVVAEYRLLLLNPEDGGVVADLTPESRLPLAVFDMRFSPDGRHLCLLGNDLHILTIRP
ncbi:MAG: WD40 repeat domain-containing protein [Planctomycetota bacterium]